MTVERITMHATSLTIVFAAACTDLDHRHEPDDSDTAAAAPTNDTDGDTPPVTCGNHQLDSGEECDGTAFSDVDECVDIGVFVAGDVGCTADCTIDHAACVSASDWIQDARDAADGDALSLPIDKVLVTQLQAEVGELTTGFYVQAEQAGPALFVEVDPSTLAPAPRVGDQVGFRIHEKETRQGQPVAKAIDDWTVASTGHDLSGLAQDLSGDATFLEAVGDVSDELVTFTATLLEAPTGEGPIVWAEFSTLGYPRGHERLRLRGARALFESDDLDLDKDCQLTFTGILHRSPDPEASTEWALATLYASDAVSTLSCNAPAVVSAETTGPTGVRVTFDRNMDEYTVEAQDFTFSGGLTASAATRGTTNPQEVEVITSAQVSADYTVTVQDVTDTLGKNLHATANVAYFRGTCSEEALLAACDEEASTACSELGDSWAWDSCSTDLASCSTVHTCVEQQRESGRGGSCSVAGWCNSDPRSCCVKMHYGVPAFAWARCDAEVRYSVSGVDEVVIAQGAEGT